MQKVRESVVRDAKKQLKGEIKMKKNTSIFVLVALAAVILTPPPCCG